MGSDATADTNARNDAAARQWSGLRVRNHLSYHRTPGLHYHAGEYAVHDCVARARAHIQVFVVNLSCADGTLCPARLGGSDTLLVQYSERV